MHAGREKRRRRGVAISPLGHVVRTHVFGEPVFFTVVNTRDTIQKVHLRGEFYEMPELAIIARHFPFGGSFLDIGTNIGNHTIYATKFLRAARVVCIEPNPSAVAILSSNIALNGLDRIVDQRYLGVGLSDRSTEGVGIVASHRNLGGGRVVEGGGDLRLERADALLAGQNFDFIKIDVEGMELAVLAGLAGLLSATRPTMFVEVDDANAEGFAAWLEANGYCSVEQYRRYDSNMNHLIRPLADAPVQASSEGAVQ